MEYPSHVKRLLILLLLAMPALGSDITSPSVLTAMNEERVRLGLRPLREDARLDAAAADRMRDMEELAYWAHEAPDGRSPFLWLRVRHYDFRFAGENLATGFESTELLVAGWMRPSGSGAVKRSATPSSSSRASS